MTEIWTKDVNVTYIVNKIAPQTQMFLLKLGSLYKGTLEQTYSWQNLKKKDFIKEQKLPKASNTNH